MRLPEQTGSILGVRIDATSYAEATERVLGWAWTRRIALRVLRGGQQHHGSAAVGGVSRGDGSGRSGNQRRDAAGVDAAPAGSALGYAGVWAGV